MLGMNLQVPLWVLWACGSIGRRYRGLVRQADGGQCLMGLDSPTSSANSKWNIGDHVQNLPFTTIDSALVNEIKSFEQSYPAGRLRYVTH